jgi:hypothetical protein
LTAHLVDSLITGVATPRMEEQEIPGPETAVVRMGDPDVGALQNEYAGDESPGASTPTPDQNLIDAIGQAYGVADAQNGALRTSC